MHICVCALCFLQVWEGKCLAQAWGPSLARACHLPLAGSCPAILWLSLASSEVPATSHMLLAALDKVE